jgi:excisionase family DNA binding protein
VSLLPDYRGALVCATSRPVLAGTDLSRLAGFRTPGSESSAMQELPPLAPQHLTPMAFTIEEASQVSRIGRNNLYLAVQTGALRARKLGKKTLILRDDLRAWLESLPPASSGGASEAENSPEKLGPRPRRPPPLRPSARLIAGE